ncbi:MAG: hypothetical protein SF339_13825 [Blastocatellia bacterium]|nr:hypothetical protein [Blastocatellia bacterium]
MFKKWIAVSLAALLSLVTPASQVFAAGLNVEREAARVEKVKAGIAKLGVGEKSLVTVKLRDKKRVSGHITAINDESFVVADAKTGVATEIPYPNVTQVKGHNLSTGAKITIGVLIGVAVVVAILVAKRCENEGGCL